MKIRKVDLKPDLRPFARMFGKRYLSLLAKQHNEWWVVMDNGEVVAVASAQLVHLKHHVRTDIPWEGHLTSAAVLRTHRGQGIQRKLLASRMAWLRKRGVRRFVTYTYIDNTVSLMNLTRLGFRVTSIQKGGKINLVKELER